MEFTKTRPNFKGSRRESMSKGDMAAAAQPICARLAGEMGYELVEVSLDREPAGKYLRIYLDTPGGITLNDCEAFHRRVQPLLEHLDYDFLEVGSPGLDRPIKTPEDFVKNAGEEVEVRLFKPLDGKKIFQGTLDGLKDGNVVISTDAAVAKEALVSAVVTMNANKP